MFKITNKKTGFFYYLSANETTNFMFRNDVNKYSVKEIKTIDLEEIKYAVLAVGLMFVMTLAFIYFATN